jgi:SAM-dependent methyltransferase
MVKPIGKKVKQFYNQTPFPDYQLSRFNSQADLELAAYPFARVLDRSIPQTASIVDVGTGTGQLSAFLSLRRKSVYGLDFTRASLDKARKLKKKLKLDSWQLREVDIMDPQQIRNIGIQFDYLLCMGVLHSTEDPAQGFENIIHLLKPGGYLVLGLYNRWGRIPLQIRKFLVQTVFRNNQRVKDWFIKPQIGDVDDWERTRGWWHDQYLHPHETTHTVGEVLSWFKMNNVDYFQTLPSLKLGNQSDLEIAGVWNKINEPHPSLPLRFYQQVKWIVTTDQEGGYWLTFGRKAR